MTLKKTFGIEITDITIRDIFSKLIQGEFQDKVIVTPNVDHINRFHKDKNFMDVYKNSDIYINDSQIIRLLSRFAGEKLEYTNPGSDLTRLLFELSSEIHLPFCAIGAETDDIAKIQETYNVSEFRHIQPSYGFIRNDSEVNQIIKTALRFPNSIFFIAVGSPQQEVLACKLRDAGVRGVFICCGASLLFLSGKESRAPKFIQSMSLEWLYRLLISPKRLFKRYLVVGPYIFLLTLKYFLKYE